MSRKLSLVLVVFLLAALVVPAAAQDDNTLATQLMYPRNLSFDAQGNLYIAEAGTGGSTEVDMAVPGGDPEMADAPKPTIGLSSQIVMVAPDGTQSVLLQGGPSLSFGAETLGMVKALRVDESLWVLLNEGAPGTAFNTALVGLDAETLRIHTFVDVFAYEIANNPDQTEEIYSNPSDFAVADDGTFFIVDTGGNALYTWTPEGGLQLFNVWLDLAVPTSVALGPNGDVYVGFLGAMIAPGAGRVEHWTRDGELVHTYGGLTAVTSILVDDTGTVYAVQMFAFGEQGPAPESGSVVTVSAEGATPVAEGLNAAYGIAQAPDGRIVVSTGTAFAPPASGTVVVVR